MSSSSAGRASASSRDRASERTPLLSRNSTSSSVSSSHPATPGDVPTSTDFSTVEIPSKDPIESGTTAAANDQANNVDPDKPFAARQISLLCFAHLVEPVAFFSIFPFINQMVAENGNLTPADTGFYSGLIESLFSLTQMCVMIVWGKLSDRYGRKPVLVISLWGCAVAVALFGFAKTIWQMLLFRSFAGVFAGTVVTIRTMISEHSTAKTQAKAFSWFAFAGNMGILFGPLIGGALADPIHQYPKIFKPGGFLETYPYSIATLTTGSISAISAVLTMLFVDETLGTKSDSTSNQNNSSGEPVENAGTWSLLKSPGVGPVLYLYGHIMLLMFSYTALLPVFFYEPISLGGFGFSPFWISVFLALIGLSQAIWLLGIFPPLQHRIGTGGVLRWCAYSYPPFFLACPLLSLLLRQRTHATTVLFWIFAPLHTLIGVGVSMCFTAIQLALNDVAPSPLQLGELNAIALTITSGLRAFSPAAFTSLFAISVKKQLLDGYLVWLVMIVLGAGFTLAVRWLPENAEGRVYEDNAKKIDDPA